MDMFTYGTVSVAFTIGHDGKVRDPRVVSNSSNESFELVTVESVLAADIPPMPPDVVSALAGSDLETSYDFSVVSEGGGRGFNLSASASDSPEQNTR
jgi:outer membrane biosynthesis protein TonB